jgi:TolB-like protein/Tfp pilus assembly protein PilF
MALLGEMRRRNVFKVSLAYALVSWLVVQVADIVLPAFNAPQWIMQILVLILILLFPIAVLLAWAYELTPVGFVPTADVDRSQSITVKTGQWLNRVVILLLSLSVIFLVVDNYVLDEEIIVDPDFAYRQAVAVLPFANNSEAEENAGFLADGIHDELLTRLARVSDLKVISRTSVMEYRDTTRNVTEIGDELGVGSIIEGSVQRSGDSIRMNVQLIDAETDENIWADTYNRELNASNVFAIQSEISTAIAEALEAELSPAELKRIAVVPTENLPALEAYFIGRQRLGERTRESVTASIGYFEEAVTLDPAFAAAWAGIAEAWLEIPNYFADYDAQRVRREASSATIRAVTHDPESADALATLGWYLLLHNYDWDGAEDAFRRALLVESTHNSALHWYSHLLSWQGKHDEAINAARLAVDADPLSPLMQTNLNYVLLDARRWDEAAAIAEETLSRGDIPSLFANNWLGMLRARRAEEAAVLLGRWAAATGRDVDASQELGELIIRAMAYGEEAELTESLIDRAQIRTEVPEVYAALGDAENTILTLEQAHRTGVGFRSLLSMKINPSYDFVRDDPRFVALLEETGLAD